MPVTTPTLGRSKGARPSKKIAFVKPPLESVRSAQADSLRTDEAGRAWSEDRGIIVKWGGDAEQPAASPFTLFRRGPMNSTRVEYETFRT